MYILVVTKQGSQLLSRAPNDGKRRGGRLSESQYHLVEIHGFPLEIYKWWIFMGFPYLSVGLLECDIKTAAMFYILLGFECLVSTETMISSSTLWIVSTINDQWASSVSTVKASHGLFS